MGTRPSAPPALCRSDRTTRPGPASHYLPRTISYQSRRVPKCFSSAIRHASAVPACRTAARAAAQARSSQHSTKPAHPVESGSSRITPLRRSPALSAASHVGLAAALQPHAPSVCQSLNSIRRTRSASREPLQATTSMPPCSNSTLALPIAWPVLRLL